MLKKILVLIVLLNSAMIAHGQNNLNDYKYILVPNEYEFSKVKDQYSLNSLTKFLFNKEGFSAFLEDEKLPDDLRNARCLALTVDVLNNKSGLFKTKLEILLRDCDGKEIMRSEVGESRLKKFDRAYNEAFRNAFESFRNLDYSYEEKEKQSKAITDDNVEMKEEKTSDEAVEKEEKVIVATKIKSQPKREENKEVLYAQSIDEGYQLVNNEPKVVMVLLTTSAAHIFMVKNKEAIVYKENDSWIYYESDGNTKIKKTLIIKF
jgi:hypothetical protein